MSVLDCDSGNLLRIAKYVPFAVINFLIKGNLPYRNCISTFVIFDSKDFVVLSKMKLAVVSISIAVLVAVTITILIVICSNKRSESYPTESTRGSTQNGTVGNYYSFRGLDHNLHSNNEFREKQRTSDLTIQPDDYASPAIKFDVKAENAKTLKAEQAKLAEQQAAMRNFQNINAINNSKGATTVNQTSVHSSGEPNTDHSDLTAKHLASALYA